MIRPRIDPGYTTSFVDTSEHSKYSLGLPRHVTENLSKMLNPYNSLTPMETPFPHNGAPLLTKKVQDVEDNPNLYLEKCFLS